MALLFFTTVFLCFHVNAATIYLGRNFETKDEDAKHLIEMLGNLQPDAMSVWKSKAAELENENYFIKMTYHRLQQELKTAKTVVKKGSLFVQFQMSRNRVEVQPEFINFIITDFAVKLDTSILDFRQNPNFLKGVSQVLVFQPEKSSRLTIEIHPKSPHSETLVLSNFSRAFVFNDKGLFVKDGVSWFVIDSEEISHQADDFSGCGKLEYKEMVLKRSANGLAAVKIENEVEGKLLLKQQSGDSWKEYVFNKSDFSFTTLKNKMN